jgi:hypothetical protein
MVMLYQKIYIADTERNLTFCGTVSFMNEDRGMVSVSLLNVAVYEYSSSNYLYSEAEVSFTRPKGLLLIEEA